LRAVIEQAKGVLVERHGITLDEAFTQLRELSQQHNVRLVEVAATVVGVAVPESVSDWDGVSEPALRARLPASPRSSAAWRSLQTQPDVRAGTLSALLDSVTATPHQGDEAAGLLLELLSVHGVGALVIFRASLDGSLRVVGQAGYPGDAVSAWRHIPPGVDVPLTRAVASGEPVFFGDQEVRDKEFPALARTSTGFAASASIPVRSGGDVSGVVGLSWWDQQAFDPERADAISRSVERIAGRMLRHVIGTDPELDWATSILAVHMDPWVLLEAIPGADGQVRDFVVQAASDLLPGGPTWLGRRLLELWPALAEDGTATMLAGLARTGGLWTTTLHAPDTPWTGTEARAVRVGNRVVLVWRSPPRG
jgi:hypothetical protein